jgi:hypothetical protein
MRCGCVPVSVVMLRRGLSDGAVVDEPAAEI